MGEASTGSAVDRRTAIADAAITVLATDGSRGLTHRAVDRALALPEGSTSAYFRTRASLLVAATNRLADLDRASIDDLASTMLADDLAPVPGDFIAALVDAWTAPGTAPRQLARIELQLEALRTVEVADALAAQRSAFVGLVRTLLGVLNTQSRSTTTDLDEVAGVFTSLVDGLITDRLLHRQTAVPADRLADSITRLLAAAR